MKNFVHIEQPSSKTLTPLQEARNILLLSKSGWVKLLVDADEKVQQSLKPNGACCLVALGQTRCTEPRAHRHHVRRLRGPFCGGYPPESMECEIQTAGSSAAGCVGGFLWITVAGTAHPQLWAIPTSHLCPTQQTLSGCLSGWSPNLPRTCRWFLKPPFAPFIVAFLCVTSSFHTLHWA